MSVLYRLGEVVECEISRRVNRFVVEVLVEGRARRAYLNNTGRLLDYLVEGRRAYCTRSSGKKTEYRLVAVSDRSAAAIVDTRLQATAFEIALARGLLPWLRGCGIARRNAKLRRSLIDYLLECERGLLYLEIKSAVARWKNSYATYPDCPTARGRRHIRDLIDYAREGGLAGIAFIAALPEVEAFRPYSEVDKPIAELLREARRVGVLVKALGVRYDPPTSSVVLDDPDLRVEL